MKGELKGKMDKNINKKMGKSINIKDVKFMRI